MHIINKIIATPSISALWGSENTKKMSTNSKDINVTIAISFLIDLINVSNILFTPYIPHFSSFQ